jgi:hypothetical protein
MKKKKKPLDACARAAKAAYKVWLVAQQFNVVKEKGF